MKRHTFLQPVAVSAAAVSLTERCIRAAPSVNDKITICVTGVRGRGGRLLAMTLRVCLAVSVLSVASQQSATAQSGLRELLETRRLMVQEEIAAQGIENERLLEAMREVPREQFLPLARRNLAYLNVTITY